MRRLLPWLGIAAGLVLIAPLPAGAVGSTSAQISDVQVTSGRVQFVFSADGLGATDKLDPRSIQVSANGVALKASASLNATAATSTSAHLREVTIALDSSGSMKGSGITAARTAALAYAAALPPDVRVGLVTFADAPHTLLAPTGNRAALRNAINTVVPDGNTALYDGIIAAVQAMAKAPPGTERRLVILSDGDDTASDRTLTDAVEALNRSKVAADVVAFRLPGSRTTLNQIAASSSGRVLPAANATGLAKAFATAAQAFSQQVVVTAQVPQDLAGQRVTLAASVKAGRTTVRATTKTTLATASTGSVQQHHSGVTKPAAGDSQSQLWLAVGLAALAIVVVAVAAIAVPAMGSTQATKESRLTEVGRYRIVESMGRMEALPVEANEQSAFTKATLSVFERLVSARGKRRTIADKLDRAGIRMRPEEWAAIEVCTILLAGAALGVVMESVMGVVVGLGVAWFGFRFFLKVKINRRSAAFGEQLPDVLQLIAGSLRSGFSLNQAITGVVSEGTEPVASEFARALSEARLGAQIEDSIDRVAERMQCLDLHLVVMAIRISREVGGNLAEVLLTTVSTMRERGQLKREVKVLSAEGRLSAKILIGLPFLMLIFLLLFKPGYIRPLYTTGPGYVLIAMGVGALATGSFWVSRLVKIEV